jgi:hypothetical protein
MLSSAVDRSPETNYFLMSMGRNHIKKDEKITEGRRVN